MGISSPHSHPNCERPLVSLSYLSVLACLHMISAARPSAPKREQFGADRTPSAISVPSCGRRRGAGGCAGGRAVGGVEPTRAPVPRERQAPTQPATLPCGRLSPSP